MQNLFNFSCLDVSLERKTKSAQVQINFNSSTDKPEIFISELNQFIDWLSNKTEIASVLFEYSESTKLFSDDYLKNTNPKTFVELQHKIQELNWIQLIMPQTFIWHMDEISDYHLWELAFGADLRICHKEINLKTNLLERGLQPFIAGPTLLNKMFNSSKINSYLITGLDLDFNQLQDAGIVHLADCYDIKNSILFKISKQSPTARMQFKRSTNNELISAMSEMMNTDREFFNASMMTMDWKNHLEDKDFISPKELGKILKENKEKSARDSEEMIA